MMRRLATLLAVAVLVVAFGVVTTTPASAKPKRKFGRLKAPKNGIWLIHHYDNRTSPFTQVVGGPAFDDSGETKFRGRIGGVGRATVEQSAAWTFNSYALDGGVDPAGPCAVAYTSDNPRTLVRIHTHQGVSTENESGPLTLIPGSVKNNPGGTPEFPFAADGMGANVLDVGTHTFDGTITITKKSGATINGIILGGTNCEVEIFDADKPLHDAFPWDFDHTDTINTVTTVFKITGGTKRWSGVKGDGVLVFTYDTDEPHTLLEAHITIFKFK